MRAFESAPWLSAMARVFDDAGAPLFLVGGGVRNPLMGLPISDADVCGPLLPQDVCALCEGTAVDARVRAAGFGTVELWVDGHMAEYTAWREESYTGGHRPDSVTFTTDIRVDARRRDFSVNALYRPLHDGWMGDVIDPTGGLRHLRLGVLHTTTRDPETILSHDGQRILRAARFQSEMDLHPTDAMFASLKRNAPLIREVAMEQLRPEVEKIVMADLRYPALRRRDPATRSGLQTLHLIGAWDDLFDGVSYDDEAALALSHTKGDLPRRMALLMHRASPEKVQQAMQHMKFSTKLAAQAAEYVRVMHRLDAPIDELADPDALTFAASAFRALGDTVNADKAQKALAALEGKPLSLKELAISGSDLKPLFEQQGRPLREMGDVLDRLWRMALCGEVENTRETLLKKIEREG